MSFLKKLFGSKEDHGTCALPKNPQASKGYHACVDSCEKDMENLETECENLRKDNLVLIGKVGSLEAANKELRDKTGSLEDERDELKRDLSEREERINELEKRLEEADAKADGTPVKYASARKALTKAKLAQLRKQLENVPSGAGGFGGSCSVYDKKTKRVSLVEFKSKDDALDLLTRAEKGNVDIIM
jgi:predicted RNase H-like nuclease (RuvC/YqgF family)